MGSARIGCSGWSYRDWRDGLYKGVPASRWLERYAEAFDTVEVNGTFYRLPRRETVRRWVEQTPDGFLFAVKASRYLTHMRRLREVRDGVARFWEPLEPLREAGRLGPVLWQLPEGFHRDDEALAAAPGRSAQGAPLLRAPPPELVRGGRVPPARRARRLAGAGR